MMASVLIVSSQVRSVHSGVGTYAGMILDGLAAAGVDVTVATWSDELDTERFANFQWIDLGSRRGIDPSPGRFWSLGRRFARAVEREARAFDVVHFLDAREGHAFVESSARHRIAGAGKVIGTVHDDYAAQVSAWPFYYVGKAADPMRRFAFHRWQQALERSIYPNFDQLHVNSQATAKTICQRYGLPEEMCRLVTLTVAPTPTVEPVRLSGDPALVFVGGNYYRKGLDLCVRALPALMEEFPGVQLHVIGGCRSSKKLQALAWSLGVIDAVVSHGRMAPDEVAARVAGSDVFVMPSRTEALGLVYLEAFRAGVPVIAGDRGGVTEIVRDGESGVLVASGDPVAFASGLRRLLRDEELRKRVIVGGKEVLASRTPQRLLDETLGYYGVPASSCVVPAPAASTTESFAAAAR